MHLTHSEIVAGLLSALAASSYLAGILTRWKPSKKRLKAAYNRGYPDGYDDGWEDCMKHWSIDDPRDARPEMAEGEGRALDGLNHAQVPRPGQDAEGGTNPSITGPGRTYDDITPLALSLDALEENGLPPPPKDLSEWWASELEALITNGQSDWYSKVGAL